MFTRSRTVRAGVCAGITLVGVLLAAPAAQAEPIPEKTIKSECAEAGGTYGTIGSGRNRESFCSYTDAGGDKWTDWYVNGTYTGTTPGRVTTGVSAGGNGSGGSRTSLGG